MTDELETCKECFGSGECQWAHGDCPFCDGRGVILVSGDHDGGNYGTK